jgi:hypothetical protein
MLLFRLPFLSPEPHNTPEIIEYANSVCDVSEYPPDDLTMAVHFANKEAGIHLPEDEGYDEQDRTIYRHAALYRMARQLKE